MIPRRRPIVVKHDIRLVLPHHVEPLLAPHIAEDALRDALRAGQPQRPLVLESLAGRVIRGLARAAGEEAEERGELHSRGGRKAKVLQAPTALAQDTFERRKQDFNLKLEVEGRTQGDREALNPVLLLGIMQYDIKRHVV